VGGRLAGLTLAPAITIDRPDGKPTESPTGLEAFPSSSTDAVYDVATTSRTKPETVGDVSGRHGATKCARWCLFGAEAGRRFAQVRHATAIAQ